VCGSSSEPLDAARESAESIPGISLNTRHVEHVVEIEQEAERAR